MGGVLGWWDETSDPEVGERIDVLVRASEPDRELTEEEVEAQVDDIEAEESTPVEESVDEQVAKALLPNTMHVYASGAWQPVVSTTPITFTSYASNTSTGVSNAFRTISAVEYNTLAEKAALWDKRAAKHKRKAS